MENCGLRCSFCGGLGHTKGHCWKKKDPKTCATVINYLEVLVDDKEMIQNQLDKICGSNHDLFSHIRVPKRRIPMEANTKEPEGTNVAKGDLARKKDVGISLEKEYVVRSKILTHFIKGKIHVTPMQTILTIPRELEYLEWLVTLTRRRKNEKHKTVPTNVVA
jgi:hypothetical protein